MIEEILAELTHESGLFPREAIEKAVLAKEAIVPHLLTLLSQAIEDPEALIEHDAYQGHIYALYLLAQFREEKAYPIVLQLLALPGEMLYDLLGETLTEDMGRILATLSLGRVRPLQLLIENPHYNDHARAAALQALVLLVGLQQVDREVVLGYFHELLTVKLERIASPLWNALALGCTLLHPGEVLEELLRAYREGLVNSTYLSEERICEKAAEDPELLLRQLIEETEPIDDAVTEMERATEMGKVLW